MTGGDRSVRNRAVCANLPRNAGNALIRPGISASSRTGQHLGIEFAKWTGRRALGTPLRTNNRHTHNQHLRPGRLPGDLSRKGSDMYRYRRLIAAGAGAALLSATPLFAQLDAPPGAPTAPPAAADQAIAAEGEVYNQGPLHEAFATPSSNDPLQSQLIRVAPPEPIDEVPPDEQPVGENIIWIPGYWAFDEDLDDFLWVSGLWRDAPPNREWVPGYWVEAEGGYRWVHGMWASAEANEITYLPQPPASQEQGPSSPAPGDNYFYVPGNWEYQNVDYRWRPGFWAPRQRDWLWVPAAYHWSPGGYVYAPGYWDYGLANRGVVYAPMYFQGGFRGGFFQPVYALNTWQHLMLHLFVRPNFGHYMFGNYYGPGFANRGFIPWHQYGRRNRGFDPLFSYYNWRYGNQYVGRLDQWHDYFVRNENYRPRRRCARRSTFARANPDNEIVHAPGLASRIDELRERQELPVDSVRSMKPAASGIATGLGTPRVHAAPS